LNSIITGNLVGCPHCHLHTFCCIQWECELVHGRPKARCYPFDIQGHQFWNKNPKVKTYNMKSKDIVYDIAYNIVSDIGYNIIQPKHLIFQY
jgi:hypothetical protein